MSNEEKKEQGAPAVVGQIKVSDEMLDFSSFKKATKNVAPKKEEVKDGDLTPRERAILERLKAKAENK
ncbi:MULTISPECIES: hypothetical protein [unclassified Mycoplasma]|uniref:hypothetical protein n=1 Tax=unclassified Mycoplasma TaxID=2683645 RepID=UPI00216B5BDE|nr:MULTISPECIES: hypothetical protein [unclassified Mycoplasma]MCS4536571.1 hypothetical protein [Mycoplasma sp. CSL7475-4]MCT4469610.1 hypothetical protein [Mycoplasma sp. HS2188]